MFNITIMLNGRRECSAQDKSVKTKALRDKCAQAKSAKRQLRADTHKAYF